MQTLRNEKGIALVMVLVLAFISLAVVSSMIYFATMGTRISGEFKRFATTREAASGGADITEDFINDRGGLTIPTLAFDSASDTGANPIGTACNCGDPLDYTDTSPDTCLCVKLCNPTYDGAYGVPADANYMWKLADATVCENDPDQILTAYDVKFTLPGPMKNYNCYVMLIDTALGMSSQGSEGLGGGAVVASKGATIFSPPSPYLYSVEILAEEAIANPQERSLLSLLYAY